MQDKNRIDSHKLIYHIHRVSDWLDGKDVHPIYIEVGPIGRCNHRCIFCAFDYLKYKGPVIDKKIFIGFLQDAAVLGVKSVMYAGEGEPLLHPDIVEIVNKTKEFGIDVAITTNGVLFGDDMVRDCIDSLSWVKFSVDAASAKTYAKIHRCKEKDFDTLVHNIEETVIRRNFNGSKCAIGMQMLLISENRDEVYSAASLAKQLDVDYFVIKPFTKHPMSDVSLGNALDYKHASEALNDYAFCDAALKNDYIEQSIQSALALSDAKFDVIIRSRAMEKIGVRKTYDECLGYRFWSYLDSNGDLYSCSAFLGNKNFCYGNIYANTFQEIWNSDKRQRVVHRMSGIDVSQCRETCRLDEVNRYLWELVHPSAHVNFL